MQIFTKLFPRATLSLSFFFYSVSSSLLRYVYNEHFLNRCLYLALFRPRIHLRFNFYCSCCYGNCPTHELLGTSHCNFFHTFFSSLSLNHSLWLSCKVTFRACQFTTSSAATHILATQKACYLCCSSSIYSYIPLEAISSMILMKHINNSFFAR